MAEYTPSVFFACLMEPIHVELPDETVDVPMPEVFGQHNLLELVDVLDDELAAVRRPKDYFVELCILYKVDPVHLVSRRSLRRSRRSHLVPVAFYHLPFPYDSIITIHSKNINRHPNAIH